MTNPYYNATGVPGYNAPLTSSVIRTEFAAIATAFGLLPALSGNGNSLVAVNAAGTALVATKTLNAQITFAGGILGPDAGTWSATGLNGVRIGGASAAAATFTSLSATGNATVSGFLGVGGNLTVNGSVNALATLSVSGVATLASLGVTGNATVSGSLGAAGNLTVAGSFDALTTLSVSGNSTLSGTVSAGSSLTVTGASTFSTFTATGAARVEGALEMDSSASVGTTLAVAAGFGANGATPSARITVSGSRGSATATVLETLLQAMQTVGLITDSTTA